MIEISNVTDKCFAELHYGCSIYASAKPDCSPKCPFYKPKGCEDWVRRETKHEILLIPPEEYEKERKYEQGIQGKKQLYWIITNVPAGKRRLRERNLSQRCTGK